MSESEKVRIPGNEEVQIKIPDTGGSLTVEDVKKEADSKFKDINFILLSVVIILLVMVATLIIDSFHINSATYKEYSQKTDYINMMQKTNEVLLKQIQDLSDQSKTNQELIINLQKQVLQSFQKK